MNCSEWNRDREAAEFYAKLKAGFRAESTGLFYDVPPAEVPAGELVRQMLPLRKDGKPNWHGTGSGMTDATLNTGTLLIALCAGYARRPEPWLKAAAEDAARGLILAGTAHGEPGYFARGLAPDDAKSAYPGSSRDQFTMAVYALWRYYFSGIPEEPQKNAVRDLLDAVCRRMEHEVRPDTVPANSFRFLHGYPDDRRVAEMVSVWPHEAARLSMFYLAGFAVTHDAHWCEMADRYLMDALNVTAKFAEVPLTDMEPCVPPYAILQMHCSLRLIAEVHPDQAVRTRTAELMRELSSFIAECPVFAAETLDRPRVRYGFAQGLRDLCEVTAGLLLTPEWTVPQRYLDAVMRHFPEKSSQTGGDVAQLAVYYLTKTVEV